MYNRRVALLPLFLMFSFALIGANGAFALNDDALNSAKNFYLVGDYQKAYAAIVTFEINNKANSEAHYIKANCLVQLGRNDLAQHEYRMVTQLSPNSSTAKYASLALQRMSKAGLILQKGPQRAVGSSIKSGKVPAGTLELIRFQAARAKERALETGDAASKDERIKADSQGRSERERVERMAQTGTARGDQPPLSAAEISAMRERAAHNAEILKQIGEAKAARHEREAQEKRDELQRQAEDLERQLTDDNYNKHRDIKLNPVGTNLYIRNYAQIPPTVKPLRATAGDLNGTLSSQQTSGRLSQTNASIESRTAATGQGKNAIRTEAKVKGEVLPK